MHGDKGNIYTNFYPQEGLRVNLFYPSSQFRDLQYLTSHITPRIEYLMTSDNIILFDRWHSTFTKNLTPLAGLNTMQYDLLAYGTSSDLFLDHPVRIPRCAPLQCDCTTVQLFKFLTVSWCCQSEQ